MTLTKAQRHKLEMEFLAADLGQLVTEAPVTTATRALTRLLVERGHAVTAEQALAAAVTCLDKVVTAWERPTAHIDARLIDGVRTAATCIAEAAERAGLTMPTQPKPEQPGGDGQAEIEDAEDAAEDDEVEVPDLLAALQASIDRHRASREPATAAGDETDWTPVDGGVTPSMFGSA